MGVYLSSPITTKESSDETYGNFTYGVSSMQGWRMAQEDAHNCIPNFDPDKSTSLFAVYDGHGGAEVAKYCSKYLPDFIKGLELYKEGKLGDCLQDAFIGFDATLTKEEVIKELKEIAGVDEDEEEEDDDEPTGRTETDMLVAEANMPIEELMAKYSSAGGGGDPGPAPAVNPALKRLQKDKQGGSPMLRAKKESKTDALNSENKNNNAEALAARLEDKLENGEPDNDNNLNVEKELREAESNTSSDIIIKSDQPDSATDSVNNNKKSVKTNGVKSDTDSKDIDGSNSEDSKEQKTMSADSTVDNHVDKSETESTSTTQVTSVESSSSSSSSVVTEAAGSSSADAGPSGSGCSSSSGPSGSGVQAGGSGMSSAGSSGCSSSGSKDKKTIVDEEFDSDDSSEDEEEEYMDDSSDEDDDDDEDDDEESSGFAGMFGAKTVNVGEEEEDHNEEPGSDSGCTAVVALLRDNQLVVANAGDSRCVLCRDGKALDLSFDHKPEDTEERQRIEGAGGKVTSEGRVNGGLNLSRAIGDHWYKRNETKEAKDQMISAFPDIEQATLTENDEFMVIACDGIWNFMTSQEVVDFVKERLKDPAKAKRPSLICEEVNNNYQVLGTADSAGTLILEAVSPGELVEALASGGADISNFLTSPQRTSSYEEATVSEAFALPTATPTAPSLAKKRKLTSHRILTSIQIINEKREAKLKKEQEQEAKEARKVARQLKMKEKQRSIIKKKSE